MLPLVPAAAQPVAPGTPLVAQVPVRWKAGRTPAFQARLLRGDGSEVPFEAPHPDPSEFARPGGGTYTIPLPPLPPGDYRLIVDVTAGGARGGREVSFSIGRAG